MTPLKFTHTTHETDVYVYADQVVAVLYLPQFKSVALMGAGGAYIPVLGEQSEIATQIANAKANEGQTNINKELKNGTKTNRKR